MWSSGVVYLLSFLILFGVFETGTCYQCYSCIGVSKDFPLVQIPIEGLSVTGDCVDPISASSLSKMECNQPGFTCVKGVNELSDTIKMTIRACLPQNKCKEVAKECYSCDGELCNASLKVVPSLTILGVISLVLANYYM